MVGLKHEGFLIPNAGDVTNPRMAEPDQVDFNTLAHPLWGVIEGGKVTVSGTTATVQAGTVLVNGALVALKTGTVALGGGETKDRFDLIVADAGGSPTVVKGAPDVDPVFPDPPANTTVLAAVFAPTGASTLAGNVIDKRKFVNKALLTKIGVGEDLVRNLNGSGNHFLVDGGGKTTWESDTWMWRSSPETLSVHKHLKLEGTLTAEGEIHTGGDIAAGGNVYGDNLHWDTVAPTAPILPGTIWQNHTTGKVYVWQGAWKEMATIESANPPGTVITSFEKPSVMTALGWLEIKGQKVYETDVPSLFQVQGLAHLIVNDTPRHMTLPNAQNLMLVTDFQSKPGTVVRKNSGNKVTLTTANLPRHKHNPRSQPAGHATPTATVTRRGSHIHRVYGGVHEHGTDEAPHRHNGMDFFGIGAPVMALMWNGQNKIDALFNDRNHTYSVEAMDWTAPQKTNLRVTTTNSAHEHDMDPNGDHDHTVTITGINDHTHPMTEDEVGSNVAFDITPDHLTVYTYVRT